MFSPSHPFTIGMLLHGLITFPFIKLSPHEVGWLLFSSSLDRIVELLRRSLWSSWVVDASPARLTVTAYVRLLLLLL